MANLQPPWQEEDVSDFDFPAAAYAWVTKPEIGANAADFKMVYWTVGFPWHIIHYYLFLPSLCNLLGLFHTSRLSDDAFRTQLTNILCTSSIPKIGLTHLRNLLSTGYGST